MIVNRFCQILVIINEITVSTVVVAAVTSVPTTTVIIISISIVATAVSSLTVATAVATAIASLSPSALTESSTSTTSAATSSATAGSTTHTDHSVRLGSCFLHINLRNIQSFIIFYQSSFFIVRTVAYTPLYRLLFASN
ncbi:hypothetical protein PUN28_019610 [Cardiocondyla obscurior]|uniref:Uncharacterized protein n=1 Tax=Cardiocondyla obscurior TaxID=286306 RepID=A0AAW2EF03_9HYME